jgi:hypothetical protein
MTLESISGNCAIAIRNLQSGNNVMVIASVPQRSNVDNSGEGEGGEGEGGEGEGGEGEGGEGEGGEAKGREGEGEGEDAKGEEGEGEGGEAKGVEGEGEGGDAKDGEGQGERTDGPGKTRELVAESIMEAARAITSAKAPAPPATILSMRVADFDYAILGILMSECGADCETWPCE